MCRSSACKTERTLVQFMRTLHSRMPEEVNLNLVLSLAIIQCSGRLCLLVSQTYIVSVSAHHT
ncbi:hypothetical protein RchiOBHm_Chr4g0429891 [Rosa chinensis]|uniref:Uncharacterized protein n=1 Tax=Rosa chinensis TaxID=74649 RepID=A0A2P6R0E4_ROSCH|nr:hypothetical protein RchiOBHm_Chr4g0429891 [Rosa chinensis]